MRPLHSLRWIVAVVVALAGGCVAAGDPPVPLRTAVERTLAAGTARVHVTVTSPATAPAIEVEGLATLDGTRAALVARFAGPGAGAGEAEVRIAPEGAWLRSSRADGWTAVDPAVAELAAGSRGWADLLRGLRPAGRGGASPRRVTAGGDPGRVWLDARGRVRRLVVDQPATTLDLRLSDFGVAVDVVAPGRT